MSLSHMLDGIYFTEDNPMDVINVSLKKGERSKKKQRVSNAQIEEVQEQREKMTQQSNQAPRKVSFKSISHPSKHVEIVTNEVVAPAGKSKKQSGKRTLVEGVSIPIEGIVELDETPSRQKN